MEAQTYKGRRQFAIGASCPAAAPEHPGRRVWEDLFPASICGASKMAAEELLAIFGEPRANGRSGSIRLAVSNGNRSARSSRRRFGLRYTRGKDLRTPVAQVVVVSRDTTPSPLIQGMDSLMLASRRQLS